MSFLTPWMLVALPLAAIPIIIHLINQRRYQTTQWAAMMFLLTANKMNRGYAKIRQWLILAVRTLILAGLIFAIGRPLVSGGLGTFLGRGASTAIVVLDRSPSMQTRIGASPMTKLESGLLQIVETLKTLQTDRVVLIDSNSAKPHEVDSPQSILQLPETGPSDKTADIPTMLSSAMDYITENNIGQSDIWICSDLRKADWNGDDGRWGSIRDEFSKMGRRIRFRLVASPDSTNDNRKLRVTSSVVGNEGSNAFAEVSLEIVDDRGDSDAVSSNIKTVPVTFDVGGNRSTVDVSVEGGIGKLVGHRMPLPSGQTRGFGSVSIPADANASDNVHHFAFDTRPAQRCVIVTSDEQVGNVLKLAAEIASSDHIENDAEVITPGQVGSIAWDELALLVWHAPLPQVDGKQVDGKEGDTEKGSSKDGDAAAIESFVARGGRVLFFPSGTAGSAAGQFGCKWAGWQQSANPVSVTTWRGDTDVLSATESGASLPVGQLEVNRFSPLQGDCTVLAKLDGDHALLCRATTSVGGVYFCTTTPRPEDSSLAPDGVMLYVMLQRLLNDGSQSLGSVANVDAGTSDPVSASNWKRLTGRGDALSIANAFVAGVYQSPDSDRWITVNRSRQEDDVAMLSDSKLQGLFDGLVLDRIDPSAEQSGSLVEEAWQAFLILMLIAMVGEACLCLPKVRTASNVPYELTS